MARKLTLITTEQPSPYERRCELQKAKPNPAQGLQKHRVLMLIGIMGVLLVLTLLGKV